MKAMLVSEAADSGEKLKPIFRENSFELIHYRSPVKALDNMEEILPDAVIINAMDFPRHWKVITQYIRWDNTKEKIIIILLTNKNFVESDADKAIKIGVQGIIEIRDGNFSCILAELKKIFARYGYASKSDADNDGLAEQVQFLFTNPVTEVIITGTVKNLTKTGLSFLPDMPANTAELKEGEILNQCSLKIENNVIVPSCKVKSNNQLIELSFTDLSLHDQNIITYFLNAQ